MKIDKVNINNLLPFNENPYRIREGEELESLLDSISENGIISPLVVRPTEEKGKYEVISGHRRLHAARMLNLETVPVTVCDVSREEAMIMLVDSNLHREHILPSEKAKAYKLKLDAMKAQGKRTDLTCGQAVHKSRESVSDTDSGRQVQRYIRLTELIPELLTMVDENKIAFSVAVELSYLKPEEQKAIAQTYESDEITPSLSQAQKMRKLSQLNELTEDDVFSILTEPKANQKPMFKMSMEKLQKYSPKSDERQMQEFIIKACEYYAKYLQKKRNREAR